MDASIEHLLFGQEGFDGRTRGARVDGRATSAIHLIRNGHIERKQVGVVQVGLVHLAIVRVIELDGLLLSLVPCLLVFFGVMKRRTER